MAAPTITGRYNVPNRPLLNADGSGFSFVGGLRTASGASAGNALFASSGDLSLAQFINNSAAGSSTVTSEGPLAANISSRYEVSPDGTRFITLGDVGGGFDRNSVVLFGSIADGVDVLQISGGAAREDSLLEAVPAASPVIAGTTSAALASPTTGAT